MASRARRVRFPPKTMDDECDPNADCEIHILNGRDKKGFAVRWVNAEIGKGVFSTKPFRTGDFLLEYPGERICIKEAQKREKRYPLSLGSFLFFFRWKKEEWCIDATFSTRKGRYINDGYGGSQNSCMKVVTIRGEPHLAVFATKHIRKGEEIRYDYGVTSLPWRKKVKESSSQTRPTETEIVTSVKHKLPTMSSKKASRDKVQVASPLQINKNADSMTENSKDEHQKEVDSSKATTLSGYSCCHVVLRRLKRRDIFAWKKTKTTKDTPLIRCSAQSPTVPTTVSALLSEANALATATVSRLVEPMPEKILLTEPRRASRVTSVDIPMTKQPMTLSSLVVPVATVDTFMSTISTTALPKPFSLSVVSAIKSSLITVIPAQASAQTFAIVPSTAAELVAPGVSIIAEPLSAVVSETVELFPTVAPTNTEPVLEVVSSTTSKKISEILETTARSVSIIMSSPVKSLSTVAPITVEAVSVVVSTNIDFSSTNPSSVSLQVLDVVSATSRSLAIKALPAVESVSFVTSAPAGPLSTEASSTVDLVPFVMLETATVALTPAKHVPEVVSTAIGPVPELISAITGCFSATGSSESTEPVSILTSNITSSFSESVAAATGETLSTVASTTVESLPVLIQVNREPLSTYTSVTAVPAPEIQSTITKPLFIEASKNVEPVPVVVTSTTAQMPIVDSTTAEPLSVEITTTESLSKVASPTAEPVTDIMSTILHPMSTVTSTTAEPVQVILLTTAKPLPTIVEPVSAVMMTTAEPLSTVASATLEHMPEIVSTIAKSLPTIVEPFSVVISTTAEILSSGSPPTAQSLQIDVPAITEPSTSSEPRSMEASKTAKQLPTTVESKSIVVSTIAVTLLTSTTPEPLPAVVATNAHSLSILASTAVESMPVLSTKVRSLPPTVVTETPIISTTVLPLSTVAPQPTEPLTIVALTAKPMPVATSTNAKPLLTIASTAVPVPCVVSTTAETFLAITRPLSTVVRSTAMPDVVTGAAEPFSVVEPIMVEHMSVEATEKSVSTSIAVPASRESKAKRKRISSKVQSAQLLAAALKSHKHTPRYLDGEMTPGTDVCTGCKVKCRPVLNKKLEKSCVTRNGAGAVPPERKKTKPYRPCPFCLKFRSRLSSHIQKKHSEELEVKAAKRLPEQDKNRALALLKKKGIMKANIRLLQEEKNGKDIKLIRERSQGSGNLVYCSKCYAFVAKRYFHRHRRACDLNEISTIAPEGIKPAFSAVPGMSEDFTVEILKPFLQDEVGKICITDNLIVGYGHREFQNLKQKPDKKDERRIHLRSDMRNLGRLFKQFKETCKENSVESTSALDMFQRKYFTYLQSAVNTLSVKEDGGIKSGLKISLGYLLKKVSKYIHGDYLIQGKEEEALQIERFLAVLKFHWGFMFGDAEYSVTMQRQTNLRKPQNLPAQGEVKKLRDYTVNRISNIADDAYTFISSREFSLLRDLVVCRLTLFNARRGGEPCRLMITQWKDAKNSVWITNSSSVEDPLEKLLVGRYKLAYQPAKRDKLVPLLIIDDCMKALNLLCDSEIRKQAGIHKHNVYVFANTQLSSKHVFGWNSVKNCCKLAKLDKHMTATDMRHYVATVYASLDVPEEDRKLFFEHMGHSEAINRNVYQSPPALKEVTVVGKFFDWLDRNEQSSPFQTSQTASTSDTAGLTLDITTEDNQPQSTKMGEQSRQIQTSETTSTACADGATSYITTEINKPTSDKIAYSNCRVVLKRLTPRELFGVQRNSRRDYEEANSDKSVGVKCTATPSKKKRVYRPWKTEWGAVIREYFVDYVEDICDVDTNRGNLPGSKEVECFLHLHPEILPDVPLQDKISRVKSKIFNDRKLAREKLRKIAESKK